MISRSWWHFRYQTKVPSSSLDSIFNLSLARIAAFLFDFCSTNMLYAPLSFWQLSATFYLIVSTGVVSSGYNRLIGGRIVFPLGSSNHVPCNSVSLLAISCTIFSILYLLLDASCLIWTICPTTRFNLDLILGWCRHLISFLQNEQIVIIPMF